MLLCLRRRLGCLDGRSLGGKHKGHNKGEESETFDKGGRDDHGRSQVTTKFRLTSHTFESTSCKTSDSESSTEYDEARSKTGTQER